MNKVIFSCVLFLMILLCSCTNDNASTTSWYMPLTAPGASFRLDARYIDETPKLKEIDVEIASYISISYYNVYKNSDNDFMLADDGYVIVNLDSIYRQTVRFTYIDELYVYEYKDDFVLTNPGKQLSIYEMNGLEAVYEIPASGQYSFIIYNNASTDDACNIGNIVFDDYLYE